MFLFDFFISETPSEVEAEENPIVLTTTQRGIGEDPEPPLAPVKRARGGRRCVLQLVCATFIDTFQLMLGVDGRTTLSHTSKSLLHFRPPHYFMHHAFTKVHEWLNEEDILIGIRRFNDKCVREQRFDIMIPESDAPYRFLEAFTLDPHYRINEHKHNRHGFNVFQPLHIKYDFPVILRTQIHIEQLMSISMKVTCGSCLHLTCCGGKTSGATEPGEKFYASHKTGCPLVLALRRFTYDELCNVNEVSFPVFRPLLYSTFYEPFHNEFHIEQLVRDSYSSDVVRYVQQNLLIANYLRYNVYVDENNEFEEFDHLQEYSDEDDEFDDEGNHELNPRRHLPPTLRFGIMRVCQPCMNSKCCFFGVCTVRSHYMSHVDGKHPGAMPSTIFSACSRC